MATKQNQAEKNGEGGTPLDEQSATAPKGKTSGGLNAKRALRKQVKEAWPTITTAMVNMAKQGDFRATKWLWEESGLGAEVPRKRGSSRKGFAKALIAEFHKQRAEAAAMAETNK